MFNIINDDMAWKTYKGVRKCVVITEINTKCGCVQRPAFIHQVQQKFTQLTATLATHICPLAIMMTRYRKVSPADVTFPATVRKAVPIDPCFLWYGLYIGRQGRAFTFHRWVQEEKQNTVKHYNGETGELKHFHSTEIHNSITSPLTLLLNIWILEWFLKSIFSPLNNKYHHVWYLHCA